MDQQNTAKTGDEEIAARVQNGETEAFGILVERYETKMLRYGRKFLTQYEDIEDAVQDVFIKAYTNIQSFNTSMSFSPWLYRIAHNTFINVIKKKGREPLSFFDPDTILKYSTDALIEPDIYSKEDRDMIEQTLSKLPPKYREPLILYYFEEKGYKEIGYILHIPTSTVGIRIKRAKEKMKILYNEHHERR